MVFIFGLILAAASIAVARSMRSRGASAAGAAAARVGGVLAAVLVLGSCFTIVPAGHVGVVDFFGSVSDRPLPAGIRLVNPLARVERMSVMTREVKETMEAPSKEGLTVQLELSLLFHLEGERAPNVYRTVGRAYDGILVAPQLRSVTRSVTSSYDARALYTAERDAVAQEILVRLRELLGPRGVAVESAPLRRVGLPARLTESIEEKLRAEQESQRMEFVLTKEKQEAERKRIEAQGIADFQRIVSIGLSEPVLRWKGIEATERLAASPNAKVVVVGAGKDGLPLILGSH